MNDFELDAEYLISLVQERPVLWDKTLDTYKDRNITKAAWNEICFILKEDFESLTDLEKNSIGRNIIKKWGNIRDAWMKWCKKQKEEKKSGVRTKAKKYIYHDQLKFLTKIHDQKPMANSSEQEDEKQLEETEQLDELERHEATLPSSSRAPEKADHQQFVGIGKKKRKLDEFEMRMIKALEAESEEDRHLSFFKGVIPSLHAFSEDQTIEFQMGVLQLIKNIKQRPSPLNLCSQPLTLFNPSLPNPLAFWPPTSSMYQSAKNPQHQPVIVTSSHHESPNSPGLSPHSVCSVYTDDDSVDFSHL